MQRLIIIGSGPAGLTAGIYASRGGVKPLVLEGLESGGQLMQTQHVANYPGFPGVAKGPEIIAAIRRQAEEAGVAFAMDAVKAVDFSGEVKKLSTLMGDTLEAEAVIIATGAGVTKTNLPGEAKYFGRGISACLTCDGSFYAGRKALVVGEGPAAQGAKAYLTRLGAEVPAVVAPADAAEFTGEGPKFTGLKLKDGSFVEADGAFLVTARTPQTAFLQGVLELDPKGHIVTSGSVKTSVPGVYAAGDCARPRHKQAVVAAGDGAIAALEALDYLRSRR